MSFKHSFGAATLALSLPFSNAASAETQETNLDISGKLSYLQESIKSGDVNFNPPNELYLTISGLGNWQANFSYDLKTNGAFDFDGGRVEVANLTYSADNWSLTGGFLGEQFVRGLAFSPGGAPDVLARENAFGLRVDRDDVVGVILESHHKNWKIESAAFAALNPDENATGVERRGNSSDISYRLRGTYATGENSAIGLEAGKNQSINGPTETFMGLFANISRPMSDNITWNTSGEIIRLENFGNVEGQNRNLMMAYTDLTQAFDDQTRAWVQGAVNIDNLKPDSGIIEIGGRYDANDNLALFLRADVEQQLNGPKETHWGGQIGFQYKF